MKLSIFDDLVTEGMLTEDQLLECRDEERDTGQPLDKVLRQKGYVSENVLLELLARRLRLPFVSDLADVVVPSSFVSKVPAQFARTYNLIAIEESGRGLKVATCDPLDIHPMDDLASMLGGMAEPVVATRSEITSLINRAYQRSSADVDELLEGIEDDEILGLAAEIEESEDVLDIANKAVSETRKKIKNVIQLDTNIQIKMDFINPESAERFVEKGWDEERQMYYYLVYFNREENS